MAQKKCCSNRLPSWCSLRRRLIISLRRLAPKPSELALEYYVGLADRVYRVLDGQLADKRYLAGEYSIADIAAYPWINVSGWTTLDIKDFPNLERWYHEISARPAVIRGMALPEGVVLE